MTGDVPSGVSDTPVSPIASLPGFQGPSEATETATETAGQTPASVLETLAGGGGAPVSGIPR